MCSLNGGRHGSQCFPYMNAIRAVRVVVAMLGLGSPFNTDRVWVVAPKQNSAIVGHLSGPFPEAPTGSAVGAMRWVWLHYLGMKIGPGKQVRRNNVRFNKYKVEPLTSKCGVGPITVQQLAGALTIDSVMHL